MSSHEMNKALVRLAEALIGESNQDPPNYVLTEKDAVARINRVTMILETEVPILEDDA